MKEIVILLYLFKKIFLTVVWYWNNWNYQFAKAAAVFQGDTKSQKHEGKGPPHISLSLRQILDFQKLFVFSLKLLIDIWIIILVHLAFVTNNYWKIETQKSGTRQGRHFPQWIKLYKRLRNSSAWNSLSWIFAFNRQIIFCICEPQSPLEVVSTCSTLSIPCHFKYVLCKDEIPLVSSKNHPLTASFDTHNSCIIRYSRSLPTLASPCHSFTNLRTGFPQLEFFRLEIPMYLSHSTHKTHFLPSCLTIVLWPPVVDTLKTMRFWDIDSMLTVQHNNSWGSC